MSLIQLIGDTGAPAVIFFVAIGMIGCGIDVCWLRFRRAKNGEDRLGPPRHW